MYLLLHRKKIEIYAANISLFLCPDQKVYRRREMMSAALIVGGGRDTWVSTGDISPVKTSTKNTKQLQIKENNYKYNKIPTYIILLVLEIATI